jgi:hypothetical protein
MGPFGDPQFMLSNERFGDSPTSRLLSITSDLFGAGSVDRSDGCTMYSLVLSVKFLMTVLRRLLDATGH